MRLNDRAADREPHPNALGLRRKERLEHPVRIPDRQSDTGVADRDQYFTLISQLRSDRQLASRPAVRLPDCHFSK